MVFTNLYPLGERSMGRDRKPARRGKGSPRRVTTALSLEVLEDRNLLTTTTSNPTPALLQTQPPASPPVTTKDWNGNIQHFIIIYQENWGFDSLYGLFPGANGLENAGETIPQVDKLTGEQLTVLPQPLINGQPDPRFPDNLPVQPYDLTQYVQPDEFTGDMVHRYYHQQTQIDGGKMDGFVSWSDNGGLVFSYVDATSLPEGKLAQQYVLADDFFHSAYGGSFLNAQFLAAAAPPVFPDAPDSLKPVLDDKGHLLLDENGKIVKDGAVTPDGYGVNTLYSVNLVPPFITDYTQLIPSQNDSDPSKPNYTPTIGDRLSEHHVSWKWYAGGWDDVLAGNPDPLFQWHHHPFVYFDNYAPGTQGQKSHIQDEQMFFNDLYGDNLPKVSFIKPLGPDNEHPGYANLLQGQKHVADIVQAVQSSSAWDNTAIIITYDENGGRWDHVPPPERDRWGMGARVPAIIISPFAKTGYVDHTQYETLSILKTIEEAYNLEPLNERDANATGLDNAFQFPERGQATVTAPSAVGWVFARRADQLAGSADRGSSLGDPAIARDSAVAGPDALAETPALGSIATLSDQPVIHGQTHVWSGDRVFDGKVTSSFENVSANELFLQVL